MLLKHSNSSSSFLNVEEGMTQIASGPNSISTTRDAGNFLNGPVSFTGPHSNIKFGAVFRFNPLLATCIPSTLATPISTFTLDVPLKNMTSLSLISSIIGSIL